MTFMQCSEKETAVAFWGVETEKTVRLSEEEEKQVAEALAQVKAGQGLDYHKVVEGLVRQFDLPEVNEADI